MTALPNLARALAAALLLASALPALALYKVIAADGSVTYTDRPPVTSNARITTFSRSGEAGAATDAALPFELRQAVSRFPVTLYTSPDCPPCEGGRVFLQQRGVPFAERRVATEDDAVVLERTVGGRTVPALTVGSQALRGFSQNDWKAFIDAAGYPRESRLPRNYQAPAVTPLVDRAAPAAVRTTPTPGPAAAPEADETPAVSSDIRF